MNSLPLFAEGGILPLLRFLLIAGAIIGRAVRLTLVVVTLASHRE